VAPADLVLSWGYHAVGASAESLRATLNLTWGDDRGLRVVMPPARVPDALIEPSGSPWLPADWFYVEGGAGAGIEQFRFADGRVLTMADVLALAPPAPPHPTEALRVLAGGEGEDLLVAESGSLLVGAEGDDHLTGSAAADVLIGGPGDDRLAGGSGSDLYRFECGEGTDRIVESAAVAGDVDVLQLGADIVAEDTTVVRRGDDLMLRLGTDGDAVVVEGWFARPEARLEQIVFADGALWDAPEIARRAVVENRAPVAVDPPDAAIDETAVLALAVPAGTFVDADGDPLALSAALADGAPLPAWLGFDATTATFTGVVPLDAGGSYRIALAAADPLGATATAEFTLAVRDLNPPLAGDVGDDVLAGSPYPDLIDGGAGADRLSGGGGDDVLSGGPGADLLDGGDGDDALHFSADAAWPAPGTLLARIAERLPGVDLGALARPRRASLDTFVGGAGVDTLVGTDGDDAVLGAPDPLAAPRVSGVERFDLGAGDDLLVLGGLLTSYGSVVAHGGDGDDSVWTSIGADHLVGGDGADDLHGGAGSDVLDGGPGDDLLFGGRGGDTYRYARGDGSDRIGDVGPTREIDRLVLSGGLGPDDLWLARSGSDLVLSAVDGPGSIAITGWYLDPTCRVERIEASDGRVLLAADVERLVSAMAAFRASGAGEAVTPLSALPPLAPVIAATWLPPPI
nr:putative Ig domain-containing protein [Gammaproteobacteria bacterium]